jgi:hypothetical protein
MKFLHIGNRMKITSTIIRAFRTYTHYEGLGPKLLQSLDISLYYGNGMDVPNDQPNVPLALLRLSFILY